MLVDIRSKLNAVIRVLIEKKIITHEELLGLTSPDQEKKKF
jgi:hypothetical protein